MVRRTLLLLSCCVPGIAAAADNGLYLGAGVTRTNYGFENSLDTNPFDNDDHGYKAIVGFRMLDSFGVELNYADHGHATVPSGIVCTQFITVPCPFESRVDAQTLSAFAVGYLDLPLVDLFAKAGASSWDLDVHGLPVNSGFNVSESGTDFAWGAGAQAHFGSLGLRLEYEQFGVAHGEKLGTVSLSFLYTFL